MKDFRNISMMSVMTLMLLITSSCKQKVVSTDTYLCPMHPTVTDTKPATCPVCGMDLVRKAQPGEEVQITDELAQVMRSTNEVVVGSTKTIKPEFKSASANTELQGIVTYDTRSIYTVPSRVAGRVEKVYLKFEFQSVQKGQHIADIYSPEMITAQREYLYVLENDASNTELIESANRKLDILGLTAEQISNLRQTKEVKNTFAIYSLYSGYLLGANTSTPSSQTSTQPMNGGMSAATSTSAKNTDKQQDWIQEGSYVSSGQTLFRIANPSSLRIEFNIPASAASTVKSNQEIEIRIDERTFSARVDLVQPFIENNEQFGKMWVLVPANAELRIGQIVSGSLALPSHESLWIPRSALLDLGTSTVVFVKDRNVFKPQTVITGTDRGDLREIKKGLVSSDEIALHAHYMVDSESIIKTTN